MKFSEMTPEQRAEYGRKGAMRANEVRREKRKMREVAEVFLGLKVKKGKGFDISNLENITEIAGKNITTQEQMIAKQVQSALKGDLNALRFLMELTGQKPAENINITNAPQIIRDDVDE